jgi:uncharacterized protein YraI
MSSIRRRGIDKTFFHPGVSSGWIFIRYNRLVTKEMTLNHRIVFMAILFILILTACQPASSSDVQPASVTETYSPPETIPSNTPFVPPPSSTPEATQTFTPSPTETATATPLPLVESLEAIVAADLLSCRYGPGATYLYLYGLKKGARLKLIGRAEGNNWVYVDGRNKCWVNAKFIEINGDMKSLPNVYPDKVRLPVSPYYPPTTGVLATRNGNSVEISWNDVPLRAGDEEDENMQHYIVEVWRCEGGQMIFESLGTNDLAVIVNDEPGCSQPSHGRVFVQEKHGFAGPSEIPWPAANQ